MREDMHKVLVEKPRRGGGYVKKTKPNVRDIESLPSRERMKDRLHYSGKELNENLKPLWGFLRSRAGKPWDKVYSEIRASMDTRSVIKAHIFQHLFQTVHINNVEYVDGEPHERSYGRLNPLGKFDFYVDKHGILRTGPEGPSWKSRRRMEVRERLRKIDPTRVVVKKDGVWYLCRMKELPLETKLIESWRMPPGRVTGETKAVLTKVSVFVQIHDVWLNRPVGHESDHMGRPIGTNVCREAYGMDDRYCVGFRKATTVEVDRGR